MTCFECGNPAECQHHVVPKSLGGTKTVPLCLVCHGKVHDRDFVRHRRLQMEGIKRAKEKGLFKGRAKGATKANPERASQLKAEGLSAPEIAKEMGVSLRTVFRYL